MNTATQTPSPAQAYLVGDIGGTHARFGLADEQGRVERVRVFRCDAFSGPDEAIREYLQLEKVSLPLIAALGIANPVADDQVVMTNHRWRFSIEALRRSLGFKRLLLVNDFTALALSVPLLGFDQRHTLGRGEALPGQAIGVIGPGTGLGVSGLLPTAQGYVPLQGEGGHITLPARNHREAALIDWLGRQYSHVSAERVLSGPGLVALHDAVRALAGEAPVPLTSAEISARASANTCTLCVETLHHFCAMLGTVASDLALTLGARGGVYLGGGILPHIESFFVRSGFRQRFEDKGRFSAYLVGIPTFVIKAPFAALSGAAIALNQPTRIGYEAAEQAQ